jgi:chemotaxis protein MotD
MSNLENPFLPPGRAPGAAGAATAKDSKARPTPGGRDERGQAFRNLLQNLDKAAAKAAPAENSGAVEANAATLALDAMPPAIQPEAAPSATDAARLLLGALQPPGREAQPEPRKEPGTKRDAFAALSSALAKTGTGAVPDTATAAMQSAAGEAGIAMPNDTAPIDLPGSARLADLAGLAEAMQDAPGKSEAVASDAAPEKPMSITVVRQETHLPPVMRLSPLQQVAEPIRQAVSELATARAQDIPDLNAAKPAGIAEPTKILHLQLSPVELGSITVKLRIAQGGMEIRLEASRAETAQMLANDRQALREIVKASGYALDQVSVETVHVDTTGLYPRPGGQDSARDGGSGERPGAREGRGFEQSREREQQRRDWQQDATTSKEDTHEPRDIGRPGRDLHRYL